MKKFNKITVGFVAQTFEPNSEGRFICTYQEFIAGDQCDYEDAEGNPIEPPEHEYQPYNMTLRNEKEQVLTESTMLNRVYEAIEEVLDSLDVGGEQSRQFAEEIRTLRQVIGPPEAVDSAQKEISRMRKVTVKLQMRLVMLVDEGVEISQVVNELDYSVTDTTTTADILDTEITDYEVLDSK